MADCPTPIACDVLFLCFLTFCAQHCSTRTHLPFFDAGRRIEQSHVLLPPRTAVTCALIGRRDGCIRGADYVFHTWLSENLPRVA